MEDALDRARAEGRTSLVLIVGEPAARVGQHPHTAWTTEPPSAADAWRTMCHCRPRSGKGLHTKAPGGPKLKPAILEMVDKHNLRCPIYPFCSGPAWAPERCGRAAWPSQQLRGGVPHTVAPTTTGARWTRTTRGGSTSRWCRQRSAASSASSWKSAPSCDRDRDDAACAGDSTIPPTHGLFALAPKCKFMRPHRARALRPTHRPRPRANNSGRPQCAACWGCGLTRGRCVCATQRCSSLFADKMWRVSRVRGQLAVVLRCALQV